MPPDCTHADKTEVREIAAKQLREKEAALRRARSTKSKRGLGLEIIGAEYALRRYTPCPDCGRWREGA